MFKNKKLVISLAVSLLLLVAAGFFVWKDIKSKAPNKEISGAGITINVNNPNAIVKPLSSGEIKTNNDLAKQMPDLIKAIVIKENFAPDLKDLYYKKIQEQIDLLKKDGSDSNSWLVLGNYRKMAGDYDGAIEAWNYSALLSPTNSIVFYNLGDLYGFYLKNLPKAEENFLKSIQNAQYDASAYVSLADIYWYANPGVKQDRIEKLLEKGTADAAGGQNKSAVLLRFAKYYEDIGDFANAIKYDELFIKESSENANNAEVQQKIIELERQ